MSNRFAPQYKPAIALALFLQAVLLLAAATTLDFGVTFHVGLNAMVVFWVAVFFEVRRHCERPRPVGLYFVKYGYLLVVPLNYIASVLIRQAIGQPLP